MTWVRFEDRFPSHRKIRGLSDAAFRLHVSAICWCAEQLTDGHVPASDIRFVSDVETIAEAVSELIAKGAWNAVDDGWDIHDYLVYNESADQVRKKRREAADRQQKARDAAAKRRDDERESQEKSRVQSQRDSQKESQRSHSEVTVPPSRPVPSRPVVLPDGRTTQEQLLQTPSPPARKPKTNIVHSSPEGFDTFWDVYPIKVGRAEAIKAWPKARRLADLDRIVAGAVRYRDDPGRSPEHTKHAPAWLRGERWCDEPLPTPIARSRLSTTDAAVLETKAKAARMREAEQRQGPQQRQLAVVNGNHRALDLR